MNADVSQRRRNITDGHARGKAFHNRGFAHARFAGEDRIVLATAHQDINDLPDFLVPAKHGINLAAPRIFSEIGSVLVEKRSFAGTRLRL